MASAPNWPAEVAKFTRACALAGLPAQPRKLDKTSALWLSKMVMSEVWELLATVAEPSEQLSHKEVTDALFQEAVSGIDRNGDPFTPDPVQTLANQSDAMVDWIYFTLNVAAAHRVDLNPVFAVVHEANMRKVDNASGLVRRNEDGKIMKPPGWTPPDVLSVIRKQIEACEETRTGKHEPAPDSPQSESKRQKTEEEAAYTYFT